VFLCGLWNIQQQFVTILSGEDEYKFQFGIRNSWEPISKTV